MLEQISRALREYPPGHFVPGVPGQHQQAPSPQDGGMVKAVWFRRYAEGERPEQFDRVVQGWNTANKASELSNFSVCTSWRSRQRPLSTARIAPANGIPETKAGGVRAMRGVWRQCRID